ncbi:hypothetical protein LguiB_032494 [Lonicera macranthoides]
MRMAQVEFCHLHHAFDSPLRIPPAFIKYFKGVLPSTSVLRTPAKRSWRVDMNKVDKNFYFQKGWSEFVRDNSLMRGDFLIFSYVGNSDFYVNIFDKNNCQKEFTVTTSGSDEPQRLLQRNRTVGPCESDERMCTDSIEMGTSIPVQDNTGALETPSKLSANKPFFESVLNPTYVRTGYMYIPLEFVESYMSSHRLTARLTHLNKSWLVKLVRRGNRIVFSCGWRLFVADNTLLEGDICRFELNQTDDYAFNVAILRGDRTTPEKAQGTETTQPTINGDKGKSEERTCVDSVELGTTRIPVRDHSGALETPSELGTKKPFFESVLKPSYVHKYLYIPSEFAESYMSTQRQTATLMHLKKSWLVKLLRCRNTLLFSCGWRKFVVDNTLREGDVCSFELIRRNDYTFNVVILRGNETPPDKAQRRGQQRKEEGSKREVEANVEDASSKFISKHPFFQRVLTPAYTRFLSIPSKFRKSYINEPMADVRLQYSSKKWVVNLITYKDGRVFFCGGWSKFVKQNNLQVGDACSFKLIEKKNYEFVVSISKGKSKEIGGLEDAFDKFISRHPFFHVVLSPAYARRSLCIPSKFWKSYIDEPRATARLRCSNKWWVVELKDKGHSGSYFCSGWSKFSRENSLQVGDACCFELIEKENYVFKVYFARRINNSTPSKA